jgi:hypothetical protein
MFLVVYFSTNKQLKRPTQWGIDEFRRGSAEPNASMPAPPQETQQKNKRTTTKERTYS